jgi:hypothetical protein
MKNPQRYSLRVFYLGRRMLRDMMLVPTTTLAVSGIPHHQKHACLEVGESRTSTADKLPFLKTISQKNKYHLL